MDCRGQFVQIVPIKFLLVDKYVILSCPADYSLSKRLLCDQSQDTSSFLGCLAWVLIDPYLFEILDTSQVHPVGIDLVPISLLLETDDYWPASAPAEVSLSIGCV